MVVQEDIVGKAYGFFYCSAAAHEIESMLPTIREMAQVPSDLEISLILGMENVHVDSRLDNLASEAQKNGINYMLQGQGIRMTNLDVASELCAIVNQLYQSPLYTQTKRDNFMGAVFYEENGGYIIRE